ncbi:MAG: class I SAM-dependent methyltransferase [Chloroflexi bacterium]|nr:class I SAM-dependent methyltransferase [Chloroflexota bacterium]
MTQQPKSEDQLFRDEFEVLSVGSDEYAFTVPTVINTVIKPLPQRDAYLDIGAGHGNLTRHFSKLFKHTVIVEPNAVLFDELLDWAKGNGVSMSGQVSAWTPDVKIDGEFDFAVMSHVLYYVDADKRRDFVKRAFDLLRPGGRLVLITVADRGSEIAKLYQTFFTPEYYQQIPFADEVYELVQKWGYKATNIPFHSDIRTPSKPGMFDVMDFLLLQRVDFKDPATAAKQDAFVDQYLTRENDFSIASPGGIVTLYKD